MSSTAIFEGARVDPNNPGLLVADCIESGTRSLLLDSDALPPEFFDLSTGVLGAAVQWLTSQLNSDPTS